MKSIEVWMQRNSRGRIMRGSRSGIRLDVVQDSAGLDESCSTVEGRKLLRCVRSEA